MDKRLRQRFASFYFLVYLPIGMQAPYLFLFFKRQGFTDAQLGTLAAVTPILNIFAPPLLGAVADMQLRRRRNNPPEAGRHEPAVLRVIRDAFWLVTPLGDRRRMLALLLLLSAVIFPGLMYAQSFAATLAVMLAFAAVSAAPMAIGDAITLESVERTRADYGRLRLWGSVGFAMPLIALGAILQKGTGAPASSLYPIFIGYAISRLISAAWVAVLPRSKGDRHGLFDLRAARAFANRRFIALALPAVVASGAMSAYYLYFTIYLDQVGIADNLKGYFWVAAVVAETGMMLVIGKVIERAGLKWTFVLSLAGISLRLLAFSFQLSPTAIAAVQLLHALTFTAQVVSTITFISRIIPPELRASGQTIWMALTTGIGSACGAKLSGIAAGAFGLMGMFRLFAVVAALATVAAAVVVREPEEGPPAPP
jgi:PPP family 3-phenylpropionic acid transporter